MKTSFFGSVGLLALTSGAFAHDGHGAAGFHWHASDTLGLLVTGVAAVAVWLALGRKK